MAPLVFVDSESRTRFEGGVGEYTWSSLVVTGDRMTVRWDVSAGAADCRVGWEVQAVDGSGFKSTIRVDTGKREQDNRRYDVDFTEAAFVVSSTCESWVMTMQTRAPAADADCDHSYVGVCIPPYPPDLDCGEIPFRDFEVVGSDPHGFDRDGDGIGCESWNLNTFGGRERGAWTEPSLRDAFLDGATARTPWSRWRSSCQVSATGHARRRRSAS